tara:strand:+ start:108 stop:452 length:345 start_codon:yes stop_codon:yes gene_type:complete
MKKIGLVFFLIFCFCIGLGYYFNKSAIKKKTDNKRLPVYNPVDIDPSLVDSSLQNIGLGHKIQDFKFTNQYGKTIGLENVKGKVFIAEFFFHYLRVYLSNHESENARSSKKLFK